MKCSVVASLNCWPSEPGANMSLTQLHVKLLHAEELRPLGG
jgi:hypothetical protein